MGVGHIKGLLMMLYINNVLVNTFVNKGYYSF